MKGNSNREFYAHSHPEHPEDCSHWEPLFSEDCGALQGGYCKACENLEPQHGHLNKVAWWAGKFAAEMFPPGSEEAKAAREWGYLAGLWHDLGKFAPEWQVYLRGKVDPHVAESSGKLPHATSGAIHATTQWPDIGLLLGYLIAGHHSGLGNGIDATDSSLEKRLRKAVPEFLPFVPDTILEAGKKINLPKFSLSRTGSQKNYISLGTFLRLLFSALVDADFLTTETFMAKERFARRAKISTPIADIESILLKQLDELQSSADETAVNRTRSRILKDCLAASHREPGFFSLTVPTGGGKTLSSLAFALRHARLHGLRRIIYVIPFTSIIEQNAAVFRRALSGLGVDVVLEHHSNLDPEESAETTTNRLATENWDAQIILTTNVQFFESLHANRTSRCRKLHRIARSVIVLDEAQSLPVEFLDPCLDSLKELATHYGSSVVLCTATQPAVLARDEFPGGIESAHEIIPDPAALYRDLRRVTATRVQGEIDNDELAKRLEAHPQVLCIVNTRRHARELFEKLPDDESRFHLSALMCPEHRSDVLARIRKRLEDDLPVRLVSTQLIEAGVDIDFPVVYRSLSGLDSIAQAAGRCDREGRLTEREGNPGGQLFIFLPTDFPAPPFVRAQVDATTAVFASDPDDLLHLDCIEDYFERHYWKKRDSMDQKGIRESYPERLDGAESLLSFSFRECARRFCLIDDYTEPVVIPYGTRGEDLCNELRSAFDPSGRRRLLAKLQRYTVSIPEPQHRRLRGAGILVAGPEETCFILNSDPHYNTKFGLHPEPDLNSAPDEFVVT
jgi:CRISPR-associated endonuclease/helicase Cas3